jgi:hypothetical protein
MPGLSITIHTIVTCLIMTQQSLCLSSIPPWSPVASLHHQEKLTPGPCPQLHRQRLSVNRLCSVSFQWFCFPFTISLITFELFFFFMQYWGLNLGPTAFWAGALLLEPLHHPFLCCLFLKQGHTFCQVSLDYDLPNLCLSSS